MFCFCFFRTFTPIFHFKLCVFVGEGARIFLVPERRVYPSYATGPENKSIYGLLHVSHDVLLKSVIINIIIIMIIF